MKFNFESILKELKAGRDVSRESWELTSKGFKPYIHLESSRAHKIMYRLEEEDGKSHIYYYQPLSKASGTNGLWKPTKEDLESEDWYILPMPEHIYGHTAEWTGHTLVDVKGPSGAGGLCEI